MKNGPQKKVLFAWVVLLSVLLSLFVGCDGQSNGEENTVDGDTRAKLVDDGTAVYSLVYSRKASSAVQIPPIPIIGTFTAFAT